MKDSKDFKDVRKDKSAVKERKDRIKDKVEVKENKEIKEHVKEKAEVKEVKEKEFKEFKEQKEIKEREKQPKEIREGKGVSEIGGVLGGGPTSNWSPDDRVSVLEERVAELTHFIDSVLRPDLSTSALRDEQSLADQLPAEIRPRSMEGVKDLEKLSDS